MFEKLIEQIATKLTGKLVAKAVTAAATWLMANHYFKSPDAQATWIQSNSDLLAGLALSGVSAALTWWQHRGHQDAVSNAFADGIKAQNITTAAAPIGTDQTTNPAK